MSLTVVEVHGELHRVNQFMEVGKLLRLLMKFDFLLVHINSLPLSLIFIKQLSSSFQ